MEPYIPLGIVGLTRWFIWLAKKAVGFSYAPTEPNGKNFTFSVVAAVYNEDPVFFKKALNSWKQDYPNEIIAVIDHSDKSSIRIFKEFSQTFKNARLIVTKTPGKRPALADGIKAARGEIIALVDSDTVWEENMRFKIMAPFADPSVGGISTRQEVSDANTISRKLFNIQLSNRYFNEYPFLARTGDALSCLSGRTAIYRRKAIMSIVDEMLNEKFMGKKCISGEDKALTNLVQSRGWKTRYVNNAVVKTFGAADIWTYIKQQIRWARNSWRADIKLLKSKWVWQREKILAVYIIDRFIQPFLLLLGPIYFARAIIYQDWIIAGVLFSWWMISRTVKIYRHLINNFSDIAVIPIYVVMTYAFAVVKIYALLTINKQGWITRWDKKRIAVIKKKPAY